MIVYPANLIIVCFSSKRIDKRLGYFQEKFSLTGHEVRDLSVRTPRLITYNLEHIKTNSFVIKEEMGFEDDEVKALILKKPKLWLLSKYLLRACIEIKCLNMFM